MLPGDQTARIPHQRHRRRERRPPRPPPPRHRSSPSPARRAPTAASRSTACRLATRSRNAWSWRRSRSEALERDPTQDRAAAAGDGRVPRAGLHPASAAATACASTASRLTSPRRCSRATWCSAEKPACTSTGSSAAARLDADRGEHVPSSPRRDRRRRLRRPADRLPGQRRAADRRRRPADRRTSSPSMPTDAQIVGNGIFDLAGAGLRIEGNLGSLIVKRNVIRRCGEAGSPRRPTRSSVTPPSTTTSSRTSPGVTGLSGVVGILVTRATRARSSATPCARSARAARTVSSSPASPCRASGPSPSTATRSRDRPGSSGNDCDRDLRGLALPSAGGR